MTPKAPPDSPSCARAWRSMCSVRSSASSGWWPASLTSWAGCSSSRSWSSAYRTATGDSCVHPAAPDQIAHTFRFDAELGRHITQFGSDFVMSRLFHSAELHLGCMRLGPGGLISMHPASTPQLLAVVEGEGWIRGERGPKTAISAGGAVYWGTGEMHETGTDSGLVAIVIETVALREGADLGPVPPLA